MALNLRNLKHWLLYGGFAVLAACGSQESANTDKSTSIAGLAGVNIASTAPNNVAKSPEKSDNKLLTSLAANYPNGQLPADRVAQAAKDLAQNPAVLKMSAGTAPVAGSKITAQSLAIQPQAFSADFQPVQRIQNASLYGAYFFSIYAGEVANALATNPNWALEGPAFWASLATGPGLSPVHRFQNKINGSYLYTIYDAERADIVANYSDTFVYEGVAWYALQSPGAGWSALYRFRNKTNGTYLFSAYESEKDAIVANYPAIFELEGVAYYVRQNAPLDLSVVAGNSIIGSADGAGVAAQFRTITGMARTASGNVYAADFDNGTIRQITPSGVVSTYAGRALDRGFADGSLAVARFNFPYGVVSNSAGALFVSDFGFDTIRKINGNVVSTFAGLAGQNGYADATGTVARFRGPAGMAIDTADNIYVADTSNAVIRKITPAGAVTTYAGTAGTSGFVDSPIRLFAKFNSPSGIAIDTSGNLFVTDYSNNAIRKITPTGAVSTFAGSGAGAAGFADGAGTSALFYSPRGITIDANNNLYVAEGARVRKITSSAVVSTVVGTADGSPFVPGALPNSLTLESRAESVRVFGSELFIGTGGYLLKVNGLP